MLNTELTEYFQANKDKIFDLNWLTAAIRPHCRMKHTGWRGSRMRVIQHPVEFASFLILLAERNTERYIEVGTSSGGSFYIADSYLRVAAPAYTGAIGFDRVDKLRNWNAYQQKYPLTQFVRCNSRDIVLGKSKTGAAFIDARHIDKWVLHDFEKVRQNVNLVGFHDIVRGTVPLAWEKIKEGRKFWEFVQRDTPIDAWCGIGVVEV